MADKRMFNLKIIDSDKFLEMPQSTRLFYFDLCMRADDDGFVDSPKKIMSFTGAREIDVQILLTKQFIIPFESGVCVIKDWKIHNYIQNDRYKPTIYRDEMALLKLNDNKSYALDTDCIQNGSELDSQIRLDKISLDQISNISSNEDIYVEQSSTNGTPSLESKQKTESKINSDSKQQSDSNSSFKINIVEEFLLIYNNYPCSKNKNKKKSLDLYFKWLTKGKIITLMDKKKRVKYNHLQIKFALKKFIAENEDKEEQFIPRLQTFLGENLICDYISKTKKSYENHMLKKYGEDWMKVKFEYISEV